jgi:hypothetical protein
VKTTTWYQVPRWDDEIKAVEVIRATEKMLVTSGSRGKEEREYKNGYGQQSFPTWAGAHAYLMRRVESEIRTAHAKLENATASLEKIKRMKQP